MNTLRNLRIGARLALAFGAVVALMLLGFGIGVYQLGALHGVTDEMAEDQWVQVKGANRVIDLANADGLAAYELFFAADAADRAAINDRFAEAEAEIERELAELNRLAATPEAKGLLGEVKSARQAFADSYRRMADYMDQDMVMDASSTLQRETQPNLDRFRGAVADFVAYQEARFEDAGVAATASFQSGRLLMLVMALLALVMAAALALVIARSITEPLKRAVWTMKEMGKGHLSVRTGLDQKDELGDLGRTMDQFADDLKIQMLGKFEAMSRGEVDMEIHRVDDEDEISPVMMRLRSSLRALVEQATGLTSAAKRGELATRADTGKLEGAFRDVVQGVNDTLDAVLDPINEAAAVLDRVADRDLTARMDGQYHGDHARIKHALNTALENIETTLSEVLGAAEQVASAAGQINGGSQALAQGASEQASSLEEVSSSLQEMASMARQNTGNAREARGMAEGATGSTQKGVEGMRRLSVAMAKIKESSDATAKIVKTIDEIAFQTNLLALNAAVEAARAGEAGKGFAVVAEEVRALAMRSAEAAKNTAELIEGSVGNAEEGVAIQEGVLSQLQEIEGGVTRVREVMAEIAAASEQQTDGVDQINQAVEEMNGVTQNTAASAEESASAAEELTGQAALVQELVGSFRLRSRASAPGSSRSQDGGAPQKARRPARAAVAAGGARVRVASHAGAGKAGNGKAANGGGREDARPSTAKSGNGHRPPAPEDLIPFDDDVSLGEF